MGQILAEDLKKGARRGRGRPKNPHDGGLSQKVLRSYGLEGKRGEHIAERTQIVASVKEPDFEKYIEHCIAKPEEISEAYLLRLGRLALPRGLGELLAKTVKPGKRAKDIVNRDHNADLPEALQSESGRHVSSDAQVLAAARRGPKRRERHSVDTRQIGNLA